MRERERGEREHTDIVSRMTKPARILDMGIHSVVSTCVKTISIIIKTEKSGYLLIDLSLFMFKTLPFTSEDIKLYKQYSTFSLRMS